MRELQKDLPVNMELSARASMFVRYGEDNPQYLQAVLTGVQVIAVISLGRSYILKLYSHTSHVSLGYPVRVGSLCV